MKRALAVIAMLSAAIAAWVFLRTRPGRPEQPSAVRHEPVVIAQAATTEPPGPSAAGDAAPTPASPGAPAPAPRAPPAAPPGRAPARPAAPPTVEVPAQHAGVTSPALGPEDGTVSSAASPGATPPSQAPEALVRSGAIAGAVLDAQGTPIAGATILAVAPDATDGTETFTDDDGEFVLPGLRPGRYAVFTGLGTPLAPRLGSRGVKVSSTAVTRVEVREPQDAARVHVVALDAGGHAVEGQALLVQGLSAEDGAAEEGAALGAVLASDAIFVPERHDSGSSLRVPPGTYTVVVLQRAGVPARIAREPLRVTGAPLDVTVQVGDAPAVQTGRAPEAELAGDTIALP